jgi:hypothetical protein
MGRPTMSKILQTILRNRVAEYPANHVVALDFAWGSDRRTAKQSLIPACINNRGEGRCKGSTRGTPRRPQCSHLRPSSLRP